MKKARAIALFIAKVLAVFTTILILLGIVAHPTAGPIFGAFMLLGVSVILVLAWEDSKPQ